MKIPTDASPSVQQAFSQLWAEVRKLNQGDVDMKGRRVFNAGSALSGDEYVTRRQLRDYVASVEFSQDAGTTIINQSGGSFGSHQLLSATHSDTVAAGASRGDLPVANTAGLWTRLPKGTAGQIIISDGTDPAYGTSLATLTFTTSRVISGGNGSTWTEGWLSELITVNAATKDSVANLLPATSLIEPVCVRVTTAMTVDGVQTAFSVGDPSRSTRVSASVAAAAGTAAVLMDHWNPTVAAAAAGPQQATANVVRISHGGVGAVYAGVVRVITYFRTFVAPTS